MDRGVRSSPVYARARIWEQINDRGCGPGKCDDLHGHGSLLGVSEPTLSFPTSTDTRTNCRTGTYVPSLPTELCTYIAPSQSQLSFAAPEAGYQLLSIWRRWIPCVQKLRVYDNGATNGTDGC